MVTVIEDSASQRDYDKAVAMFDVAFIPAHVRDFEIAMKLKDEPIGCKRTT